MNFDSVVSIDMTFSDYEDLTDLLRTCADVTAELSDGNSELDSLADDFRQYADLFESNKR